MTIALLAVGVGVGLISGALGLGGGILMVPAFMFLLGFGAHTAKGTSLFIIIFVSLLNAWRLNRGLEKPWRLAALLATGSIVGGYCGAYVTSQLPERVVLVIFAVLLAGLTLRTFLLEPKPVDEDHVRERILWPICIGILAGLVGGATGTGGGMVLVPLVLLAGLSTNVRVVGLSCMVMVATSISGSIAHLQAVPILDSAWVVGHVHLGYVPFVFLGAQIGSPLGTRLNAVLTLPRRRVVLGVALLIITVRVLFRLFA